MWIKKIDNEMIIAINNQKKPPVVVICGATAVGKNAFAYRCLKHYEGCVINADSQQLYAGLPILTAQPCMTEQMQYPHRLYGAYSYDHGEISAVQWAQQALEHIYESHKKNRIPWIIGGSGFYLKALLYGFSSVPTFCYAEKKAFEEQHQHLSNEELHAQLHHDDPCIAQKIHYNNRQRVLRAFMVSQLSEHNMSWWQKQPVQNNVNAFRLIKIHVTRASFASIKERIIQRWEMMLRENVIAEVQAFPAHLRAYVKTIGFHDIVAYLDGKCHLDDVRHRVMHQTIQYAKRQRTWLRHQLHFDVEIDLDVAHDIENIQLMRTFA